jgi:hypothetical protein
MRRSACRAPGSIDQPTSWPWVQAITRCAPASRSHGASNASGAEAPNHTASQRSARSTSVARRSTSGTGSISDPGWRTTGKGVAASNSGCAPERPCQDGA